MAAEARANVAREEMAAKAKALKVTEKKTAAAEEALHAKYVMPRSEC